MNLQAEWFFNDDDAEVYNININIPQDVASVEMDNTSATVHNSLLLGNISKIEGTLFYKFLLQAHFLIMCSPLAKTESTSREKKDIMSSIISAANKKIQRKSRKAAADHSNSTKEEVTTPTSDSKDSSIVPLLPQLDEQKQVSFHLFDVHCYLLIFLFVCFCFYKVSLDSEESSSSDNVIPDDPLLMTYPQLEAKTNERVEKFRQETMAMLQQKRRSDSSRTFAKPSYTQNGDSHDSTDNQTSTFIIYYILYSFLTCNLLLFPII